MKSCPVWFLSALLSTGLASPAFSQSEVGYDPPVEPLFQGPSPNWIASEQPAPGKTNGSRVLHEGPVPLPADLASLEHTHQQAACGSCGDSEHCGTNGCPAGDCGTGHCGTAPLAHLQHGWMSGDQRLLGDFEQRQLADGLTWSTGGALRYRFINEANKTRPPIDAARTSYSQWRFTPYLKLDYGDSVTGFVEAIDASTFNEDVPEIPIDTNRQDLVRYYVDLNLGDLGDGTLHFKYGRQFLNYGSQHLLSPLGWSNTFRNFEGYKGYYEDDVWSIDAFAVQPVNGAALNRYRPYSFDTPDQSRWLSSVYTQYRGLEQGIIELYWIWLNENEDRTAILDGDRHTFGTRYAADYTLASNCGKPSTVLQIDYEGGFQVGTEDFITGPNQTIQAGYLSLMNHLQFNELPWKPTVSGIFWWGSGDDDPTDGKSTTVSTLFPLGHAYWGQIDNFNGQNLIDYSPQLTLHPTEKLSLNTQLHWFEKANRNDAIYNIGGVPVGGVSTTSSDLGNELDLRATYKVNANLTVQAGYFWFWYGPAISQNPDPAVANRADADMVYTYVDWHF